MPINKEKLRDLLIKRKMTYSELSEKSKVSKAQISRIMNEESSSKVRTKTLGKIAEALKVDYKELLEPTGDDK